MKMVPTGLSKTIEQQVDVALLEKRLAFWKEALAIVKGSSLALSLAMIVDMLMYYTSDVPVEYYRMFAFPIAALGAFALVAALPIASQVDTLKKRLAALRKA